MINYSSSIEYDCHGIPLACADFTIKRHDTRPFFKVDITDCDNPIDLTNLVVEASMWTNAKLKTSLTTLTTTISFADNIGFEQINLDTIIQVGLGRAFERMLITSIDEEAKTVTVLRGQFDTEIYNWKKGTAVRLLRFLNNPAVGELEYADVEQLDGMVLKNQLIRSTLVYEWKPGDTCMAGKFFLEFKILGMTAEPTPISSNVSTINYHCGLGTNVAWARRFPSAREGFLIEVFDSPTAE
jgi:hypothetical protein